MKYLNNNLFSGFHLRVLKITIIWRTKMSLQFFVQNVYISRQNLEITPIVCLLKTNPLFKELKIKLDRKTTLTCLQFPEEKKGKYCSN